MRKTVVDAEIAAFRPSAPFQSVPKPRKPCLIFWIVLREGSQHADVSSLLALLRARRERPPAPHSITSSASDSRLLDADPKRFCRLHVDDQLKLGHLLHWQFGRFCPV